MVREKLSKLQKMQIVRTVLVGIGILLMLSAPAVGVIPGPGGVIVFAAGFALALKNSEWVKRQYVRFKIRHPKKGRWADWGLRRQSAARREARRKELEAEAEAQAQAQVCIGQPMPAPTPQPGRPDD